MTNNVVRTLKSVFFQVLQTNLILFSSKLAILIYPKLKSLHVYGFGSFRLVVIYFLVKEINIVLSFFSLVLAGMHILLYIGTKQTNGL